MKKVEKNAGSSISLKLDQDIPTAEELRHIDPQSLSTLERDFADDDRKMRAIYLDSPDRKFYFRMDFAEFIWIHAFDQFEVALKEDDLQEIVDRFFQDYRYQELLHDSIDDHLSGKEQI